MRIIITLFIYSVGTTSPTIVEENLVSDRKFRDQYRAKQHEWQHIRIILISEL